MLLAVLVAAVALTATAGTALAAPANDDYDFAEALTGYRGTAYFDLTDATVQSGEPQNAGTDDRTVWFKYTPLSSGLASFSICDTDPAYEIAGANLTVFTGSVALGFTSVADSSGGCPTDQVNARIVELPVTAGTTYSIQVGNPSGAEITGGALTYDFNLAHPANDDFADAREITGALPQTIDADSGLATTEPDESGIDIWGPFNSLWYRWTPDASGIASIDTCSTGTENASAVPDSTLQLFTNTNDPADLAGVSLYSSSSGGCPSANPLLSRDYVYVDAGGQYWIRIVNSSDKFGAAYKLKLHWVTAPEINGTPTIYPQGEDLPIGEPVMADVPDWYADPDMTSVDLQWQLCDSSGNSCNDIPGATETQYTPLASDAGLRLRLKVTGSNGVQSTTEFSNPSDRVELLPAPPVDNTPPATQPAPTNPLRLSVKPALGKLTPKKGTVTITAAVVTCAATATGPCTGTVTLSTTVKKKRKKFVTAKISVAPGKSSPVTIKLSSSQLKAISKAKSLKFTAAFSVTGPGFAPTAATATGTLKPQKK